MIDNDPRQIEMKLNDKKRCIKGTKTITSIPDRYAKLRYLAENTIKHEPTKKEK